MDEDRRASSRVKQNEVKALLAKTLFERQSIQRVLHHMDSHVSTIEEDEDFMLPVEILIAPIPHDDEDFCIPEEWKPIG